MPLTSAGKLPAALLLGIAVLSAAAPSPAQEGETGILAIVNGVPIRASDIQCVLEASPLQVDLPLPPAPADGSAQSHIAAALDRLITLELLYQESLKHRYPGLELEVEERYFREVERLRGEDRLQAALRCNDTTPEAFRRAIFRSISINRYLEDHVYSRISISEEEIRGFFQRNRQRFSSPPTVRLRQILIRVSSWEDEHRVLTSRARADQVCEMASSGADFENLARRFSDDPAGAASGGDVGLISQGDRRFPFEKAAFSLSVGEVSRPITSRQGFVILKVVERPPAAERTIDEVRSQIVSGIRQEKASAMVLDLDRRLKSVADIRFVHVKKR